MGVGGLYRAGEWRGERGLGPVKPIHAHLYLKPLDSEGTSACDVFFKAVAAAKDPVEKLDSGHFKFGVIVAHSEGVLVGRQFQS